MRFPASEILTHILGKDLRESRRDSATKPRVARNELPWESRGRNGFNPNGRDLGGRVN